MSESDETWSDDDPASGPSHRTPPPSDAPIVRIDELEVRRHAHKASMQNRVLAGVFGLILITLLVIVMAVSLHGITEQFALELARLVLPAVLGSAGAIVGTLFVTRGRDES
ncbi:hypothetical protein [Amycolatopsis sp. NPDC051128]|uniref:hypothetical protein n=1 Tax=Amycolatopsis sp. NPDC051128 TaxID=3155412 RepID=UPI0034166C7F